MVDGISLWYRIRRLAASSVRILIWRLHSAKFLPFFVVNDSMQNSYRLNVRSVMQNVVFYMLFSPDILTTFVIYFAIDIYLWVYLFILGLLIYVAYLFTVIRFLSTILPVCILQYKLYGRLSVVMQTHRHYMTFHVATSCRHTRIPLHYSAKTCR